MLQVLQAGPAAQKVMLQTLREGMLEGNEFGGSDRDRDFKDRKFKDRDFKDRKFKDREFKATVMFFAPGAGPVAMPLPLLSGISADCRGCNY
jgi:hypothetical protein